MQSTLQIGATTYNAAQRAALQIELVSWSWDYDADGECEFRETPTGMVPTFAGGTAVVVKVDIGDGHGLVSRFAGEIARVDPSFGRDGWTFSYRCMGKKYQGNQLWVTNSDGTGTIAYNLPPDDPAWVPSMAGLSVGSILADLLTRHATVLTALGIATDGTTAAQLATLTVVPNEATYCQGRLCQSWEALLQRWARNVSLVIGGDGLVRFLDSTTGGSLTLTCNSDPIDPPCFSRDISQCATRVVTRGAGRIYPAYVSVGKGSLTAAWTSGQESLWKYTDFSQPNDAYDHGTVTTVDGPTEVTVRSADSSVAWSTNFWDNREAWIYLHSSVGSGFTYTESRPVTACDPLTAGGTANITLGFPLENAGSSAYDSYELIGTVAKLGDGGNDRGNVFRLFNVTDPGGLIANHLTNKFPQPVPFMNYSGAAASLTSYPEAVVIKGLLAWPATFKVLPNSGLNGQILFDEPCVKALNSQSTLNTGSGASGFQTPDDLYVLLAYSRGTLESVYPPDVSGVAQFAGTAYTGPEALQRTCVIDVESWVYAGNQSLMDEYTQMMWQSMSDTVVTGNVSYKGAYTAAIAPGQRLNIAGAGFTTGLEAAAVPIRGFTLRYVTDGAGGLNYATQLKCSSRRNPRTGDKLYMGLTTASQATFKMDLPGASILGQLAALGGAALPHQSEQVESLWQSDINSAQAPPSGAAAAMLNGLQSAQDHYLGGFADMANGYIGGAAQMADNYIGGAAQMANGVVPTGMSMAASAPRPNQPEKKRATLRPSAEYDPRDRVLSPAAQARVDSQDTTTADRSAAAGAKIQNQRADDIDRLPARQKKAAGYIDAQNQRDQQEQEQRAPLHQDARERIQEESRFQGMRENQAQGRIAGQREQEAAEARAQQSREDD